MITTRTGTSAPKGEAASPDRFMRSFRFGLGLAGLFLSTVVITLALVAVGATYVPGWHGTVVASGSMEPALRRGDAVIYADRSIDEVGAGTVVVFDNANGVSIIHRVAAVNVDGTLITKGDANSSRDSAAVTADRLEGAGRMIVPWIGLPKIWWVEGKHAQVIAVIIGTLLAARSARWTNDLENDPWSEVPAVSPAVAVLGAARRPIEPTNGALVPAGRRERLLEATAA